MVVGGEATALLQRRDHTSGRQNLGRRRLLPLKIHGNMVSLTYNLHGRQVYSKLVEVGTSRQFKIFIFTVAGINMRAICWTLPRIT